MSGQGDDGLTFLWSCGELLFKLSSGGLIPKVGPSFFVLQSTTTLSPADHQKPSEFLPP